MSDTYAAVGPKGRVVIPVAIRNQLGISEGDQLSFSVEDNSIRIVCRRDAVANLQSMFKGATTSVVDQLIAERRAIAAIENR